MKNLILLLLLILSIPLKVRAEVAPNNVTFQDNKLAPVVEYNFEEKDCLNQPEWFGVTDLESPVEIQENSPCTPQNPVYGGLGVVQHQVKVSDPALNIVQLNKPPKIRVIEDPNYIIPPQIIPNERLSVATTMLPLNGDIINHVKKWEFSNSYTFGDNRSDNFDFRAIYRVTGEVEQSLTRDNIFTSDQRGSYLQLQTVRQNREVKLTTTAPETLQGLIIQQTFTGQCLNQVSGVTDPNAQCAFVPALVTDHNSIEPQFFFPTRINQFGAIGDVISPASLAILSQPGFQNVGANGQVVGLDLYFPNTGSTPGNTASDRTQIQRQETYNSTFILGYSRIRQILKANSDRAVLGRTVRGFGIVIDNDNILLNSAVALSTELLPDAIPKLESSVNPVNTNLNRNLFSAANNTWIPVNSFTFYHAGIARANTAKAASTEEQTLPNANFNSFWIGMSPVTERSITNNFYYQPTGPERILVTTGGEGGGNQNVDFVSQGNEKIYDSASILNSYSQIYLTFLNRNVNSINIQKLSEETHYYPHLSFTGNISNLNEVFRYYGGAIIADPVKLYVGTDYTRQFKNLTLNIDAIGYINPDQDYFSRIQGNVFWKVFSQGKTNLNLLTNFRYAFEQTSNLLETPIDNFVAVGARANIDFFSLGLTQYFGDILPESVETALGGDIAFRLGNQGQVSGYLSPGNDVLSYGITAEYRFGKRLESPALAIGWRRDIYDYGVDSFDHELQTENNTFTILFRLGYSPSKS